MDDFEKLIASLSDGSEEEEKQEFIEPIVKEPITQNESRNIENPDKSLIESVKNDIQFKKTDLKQEDDFLINAENEFINLLLSFEEEQKEIKQRFKLNSLEYQAKGVNTRIVAKTVKQIARDAKKDNSLIKDENRITSRLYGDKNMISKICAVLN